MHQAQFKILNTLRHADHRRYSELMRPTGLESDVFKFHLRKLLHEGHIEKTPDGHYRLTAAGKKYANRLDSSTGTSRTQPKLSVMVVVHRPTHAGQEYLLQKRLRHPYWGYWGFITGPLHWGESPEEAAQRELEKQTGVGATYKINTFYRLRDIDSESNAVIGDRLFAVVVAHIIGSSIPHSWHGGENRWTTFKGLKGKHCFTAVPDVINTLDTGEIYTTRDTLYNSREY